jgi:hypothetical protein
MKRGCFVNSLFHCGRIWYMPEKKPKTKAKSDPSPQDKAKQTETHNRETLLEHIENNASKSEFVTWLNNQHGGAYSDSTDWVDIKKAVLASKLPQAELRSYADSLSSGSDIKKLLKDVESQTSEAQVVADKLSLLSTLKKFAVATGGACLLSGVLLLAFALSVWMELVTFAGIENIYLVAVSTLIGLLQLLAGILLVTE